VVSGWGPASWRRTLLWSDCRGSTIKLGLLCGDLRCSLGLSSSLCDLVGLVNGGFNYLLFFRIEVLCDVLVKGGLFLLEGCPELAYIVLALVMNNLLSIACLNMLYGSTLSSGVSRRLSSSSSSSSSSATEENFWACNMLVLEPISQEKGSLPPR
jgi:hypothetical protein